MLGQYEDDAEEEPAAAQPAESSGAAGIDRQLASFMQDLQASGLLKDAASDGDAAQASAASALPVGSAAAPVAAAAAAAPPQQEEPAPQPSAAAQEQDAEQKVLGYLVALPQWAKTLDTGSGSIYYWNIETNEVVWQPPEGADAEALLPAEAWEGQAAAGEGQAAEQAAEPVATATGAAPAASIIPAAAAGRSAGPAPAAAAPASSAEREDARKLLLQLPGQAMQLLLDSLVSGIDLGVGGGGGDSGGLLARVPALVRIAVEADVRVRDWRALSSAQEAAAKAEAPAAALHWGTYKAYVRQQLTQLSTQLPAALQEHQRAAPGGSGSRREGGRKRTAEDAAAGLAPAVVGAPLAAAADADGYAAWAAAHAAHAYPYDPYDPSSLYSAGMATFPAMQAAAALQPPIPPDAAASGEEPPPPPPLVVAAPLAESAAAAATAAAASANGQGGTAKVKSGGTGVKLSSRPGGSKVSALMNKWSAVRKEVQAQEEADEASAADPEARKAKEIQAWKKEQLRSGAAADNPNFTPLTTDWRARLQMQQAPAAAGTSTAAANHHAGSSATAGTAADGPAGIARSATKPDLDALSAGLPPGWRAMWDKASGDIYYGNLSTKVGLRCRILAGSHVCTCVFAVLRHRLAKSAAANRQGRWALLRASACLLAVRAAFGGGGWWLLRGQVRPQQTAAGGIGGRVEGGGTS